LKYNEIYTEIEIDITSLCNLRCPLCFRNHPDFVSDNSSMSIENFKSIFDTFPNLKVISFGFLISEPTAHRDFLKFVKYSKSKGCSVVISTNGNLKPEKYWIELGKMLDAEDRVFWPVDGSTQEIYEKYRVGGNLARVIRNQKTCIEHSKDTQHITQFIQFEHNMGDDIDKIKKMTPGTELQEIACCGDCSEFDKSVSPRWDFEKYQELKKLRVLTTKEFKCESLEEKIVFVGSGGVIGFCPTQLSNYLLTGTNHITIMDSLEKINQHCESVQENKRDEPICQFNCGTMAKKLKQLNNLDVITK